MGIREGGNADLNENVHIFPNGFIFKAESESDELL